MRKETLLNLIWWFLGLGLLLVALFGLVAIIYMCFGWAFGLLVNYPSPPKVMTIYGAEYSDDTLVLFVKSWSKEKIFLIRAVIVSDNGTVVEIHALNYTIPPLSMVTVVIDNVTYRGYGYVELIPLWGLPARHELPVTNNGWLTH